MVGAGLSYQEVADLILNKQQLFAFLPVQENNLCLFAVLKKTSFRCCTLSLCSNLNASFFCEVRELNEGN